VTPWLIVIPTYNESENLPTLLAQLFALPREGRLPPLHVLIVDDNSPDGTGALAEELKRTLYPEQLHVLHRPGKQGLGRAYVAGFHWAFDRGYPVIGQMDADFSHEPRYLPAMAQALDQADVVIGSRYVPGGGVDRHWAWYRKALSAWGNFYARTILGLPARDVTGGYRLWRADLLRRLPWDRIHALGYAFQIETLYTAYRLGARIREVPIYFPDRRQGRSKLSFAVQFEAAWRVWWMRWLYRDLG